MTKDVPTPPPGYLEVARADKSVLIRVIGLGNMNISLTMKDFIKASLDDGYTMFVLDLTGCKGMDSTFMGTLIAVNGRVNERDGALALVNVSPENEKLLRMLGVWGLICVQPSYALDPVETECLLPGGDAKRRMKLIHTAHKHLVEIDDRNRAKFGAFLAGLEKELDCSPPSDDNSAPPSPSSAKTANSNAQDTASSHRPSPDATENAKSRKKRNPAEDTNVRLKSDTRMLRRMRQFARGIDDPDADTEHDNGDSANGAFDAPEK